MTDRTNRTRDLRRPLAISIAALLFALLAVPVGLADPSGAGPVRESRESMDSLAIARADAIGGFPVPQHPEATPRGPAAG